VPGSLRFGLLLPLLLFLGACGAGWRRLDDLTPRTPPIRTQLQVWEGGHDRILHAGSLGADSITGVPFTMPPDCDSCRVSIGLSEVDSVRVGSKERGVVRSVKLLLVVGAIWAFLFPDVGGD
jgi:hypothetical protein